MKFIGWGRKHNFIHWLSLHEVGMHFDTKKFSEFFLEYLPKTTYDFELLDEKITHVGFDNNGAYGSSMWKLTVCELLTVVSLMAEKKKDSGKGPVPA